MGAKGVCAAYHGIFIREFPSVLRPILSPSPSGAIDFQIFSSTDISKLRIRLLAMSRSLQTPQGTPSSGSQVESISRQPDETSVGMQGTLRLRAENNPSVSENGPDSSASRRIRWSEDVVDNEGMGKKSSKVCCIYHKSRPVGESSSESESSDSSSDDSDSDCERNQRNARSSHHDHDQVHPNHSQQTNSTAQSKCSKHHGKYKQRKRSPNAYEKMPRTNKGR